MESSNGLWLSGMTRNWCHLVLWEDGLKHEVNAHAIPLSLCCFSKYQHEGTREQEREEILHGYII